jgi:hypothetical protein
MLSALSMSMEQSEAANRSGVEAFLLQILCNHVETLVAKGKVPDLDGNGLPDVTPEQLPKMTNLLNSYLTNKLAELDPALQEPARLVLEDGLLSEDPATGDARRTSVDGRSLLTQFRYQGLTQTILDDLERTYLVRREPNTVGGFSYEVSHDRLVEPLQKRKTTRRAEEERQRLARRQRRLIGLVASAVVVAAGAIGMAVWAFGQKAKANEAEKKAQAAFELAENQRIEADTAKAIAIREKDFAKKAMISDSLARLESEKQTEIAYANLARMKAAQKKELSVKIDQYIASARRMIDLKDHALADRILDEAARLAKEYPDLLKKIKENRPK